MTTNAETVYRIRSYVENSYRARILEEIDDSIMNNPIALGIKIAAIMETMRDEIEKEIAETIAAHEDRRTWHG
jgi:hypothetical protein